jgi:Cu-Zn family superoxide dismutase
MARCNCISINGTFSVIVRYGGEIHNKRRTMMRRVALMLLLGLSSAAAIAGESHSGHGASAILKAADGKPVGEAHFVAAADGVAMTVKVMGLPPGTHGIHLHAVGTCEVPGFASAGGHWNPMHKMHGLESPQGAHMGDLPNLVVKADGTGMLKAVIKGAQLGAGEMGLFDSDGTAIVIHAGPDDNKTDPSGNSGGRIACGVVTAS